MVEPGRLELGRYERRFLRRLRTLFVLFPRGERRRMLKLARTNLEDRPAAESWNHLTIELGAPEEYARQLVHDERALPQPALWRRAIARFHAPWQAAAALVAVVAVIAGGLAYRDWVTERPDLLEACFGFETTDAVPFESEYAMGYREQRIHYVDGAEFDLPVCLGSSETIEVLDIRIPMLDEAGPVEPLGATMQPMAVPIDEQTGEVPFAPYSLGGGSQAAVHDHPEQVVHFRYRFAGCAPLSPSTIGARFFVQPPEVTFRYRGRTHVQQLERTASLAIVLTADACPTVGA